MKRSALVGSVLVLMFIGFNVSPVAGQSESQTWGGTNFDFQKAGFATCDGPCFIWKNGDFWSQTFFSSALSSVGRLDLTLNITNVLNSGSSIFFAALVNGAQAGTFSFADGDPNGPYNFGWDLSPVSASDYEVKLAILSPDVPGGQGSVGLGLDGGSTVTISSVSVPEPGLMVLLFGGLLAFVGIGYQRRNLLDTSA